MSDVDDTKSAWRAAAAVYERAVEHENHGRVEAALSLYVDVAARLAGATAARPTEMLICALTDIALMHEDLGHNERARAAAGVVIEEHFDDPPSAVASQAVVNAAMLLLRELREAGEWQAAVDLSDRLVARYGRPPSAGWEWTTVMAEAGTAWVCVRMGCYADAIRRYDTAIELIPHPVPPEYCRVLAGALTGKAEALEMLDDKEKRNELCQTVVRLFAASRDPGVAESVAWARGVLEDHRVRSVKSASRLRLGWRRRPE